MNKAILLQQVYPKMTYLPLLVECFGRNARYCQDHDIDYMTIVSENLDINKGAWDKVAYVKDALEKYELVIWLDVDAVIFDLSRDLKDVPLQPDTIGVVKYLLPSQHFNVGVMYFKSGENVKKFVAEWFESFPGFGAWHEQEVFNRMKNDTVCQLPQEWNRNYDGNRSANPVVMGFHGFGTADERLALMRKVLLPQMSGTDVQKHERGAEARR